MLKRWCFQIVVLEKTSESRLDCKEIKPVHSKADQSWVFIGRTDAEAGVPTLWPPDVKSLLTGQDPDAGKDWRQEKKDNRGWDGWMASLTQWIWVWVNWIGDGQGCLMCCSQWGCKKSDTTEWTELNTYVYNLCSQHMGKTLIYQ